MAVVVRKELVCDECGAAEGVMRWRITRTSDGRTVSPDLCSDHSQFLENIFDKLPTGKRGQSRARPVLTEEQVRAKRERKTPPRKASQRPRKGT